MKKIIKTKSIFILCLLFVQLLNAQVELPAIVSSNMVLQRNTTVNLWGWASPEEKITIKTSWTKRKIKVTTNNDGTWNAKVETSDSKAPQTIHIKSKNSSITLENIVFGEVWLCSGQSNMGMQLKGNVGQPIMGGLQAIMTANNPNLRFFTVDRNASKLPLNRLEKKSSWELASSETAPDFSAVAYFFGQQLQEILNVPVGIIHTSWGGSPVEAWMSNEALSQFQTIDLDNVNLDEKPNKIQTVLYNAMIHPIIPYKIKGALWYQGEANRSNPENYKQLFPAMVKDWRARWAIGDFPFYYAQIAPFTYQNNLAMEVEKNTAFMREAQLECLDLIPNSGIAITLDLGSATSIHPPKKKEVADRLLMNALHQTYGMNSIPYISPSFNSLEIKDNEALIAFNNPNLGLFSFDGLKDFEIAGEDRVFYPANAKIINFRKVLVSSDQVKKPVAVRYAWKNFVEATLFDTNLLPISSFRTDDWKDAKRFEN